MGDGSRRRVSLEAMWTVGVAAAGIGMRAAVDRVAVVAGVFIRRSEQALAGARGGAAG